MSPLDFFCKLTSGCSAARVVPISLRCIPIFLYTGFLQLFFHISPHIHVHLNMCVCVHTSDVHISSAQLFVEKFTFAVCALSAVDSVHRTLRWRLHIDAAVFFYCLNTKESQSATNSPQLKVVSTIRDLEIA